MSAGTLRELYFDELCDLYDAESRATLLLSRLAEAAQHADLRRVLAQHGTEARLHLERVQLIFTHWGEARRARTCAGLAGIVQEADDRLNDPATDDARDAAIIGVAQRIAHYEIAAYGAARIFARWLNRLDDARLLEETIDEQRRAERRLTDIADARESTISAA
jgi:ferritin-like metal-binding protein YciE